MINHFSCLGMSFACRHLLFEFKPGFRNRQFSKNTQYFKYYKQYQLLIKLARQLLYKGSYVACSLLSKERTRAAARPYRDPHP